jgi:LPS O-antigen subunit length determinant protein (WzzB/FepE family)
MTDTPHDSEEDEISLLDLLQTIVENLRLLVLVPLLLGFAALGGATLWPKTYESTALLATDTTTASLMQSAAVLDPIAVSLGYTAQMPVDAARLKLKGQIKANANAKDKLLTLTAQAGSPQAAQALAQAVLQQTYRQSQPHGSAKLRLEKQLVQAQSREKDAMLTAERLSSKLDKASGETALTVAQGYAQLMEMVKEAQSTQAKIESELTGLDASVLRQEPTLPNEHISPKRSLMAILTSLATGFALLLFVFVRQALRNAGHNPETAPKIQALKAAWRQAWGQKS